MPLNLGDTFPNFKAETSKGPIQWHDYQGDSWAILFSHPKDYTPVCTTELSRVIQLLPEFEKRGVKLAALSCDPLEDHKGWEKDICQYASSSGVPYPIVVDDKRELAVQLGMVDPDERDATGMPLTCRAVFVIGPDKKVKLSILYPATTGRNFDEILRAVDSLQLTARNKVATPVDWKSGDRVMVVPTLSDDDANKLFPKGFEKVSLPSNKGYMRFTPDPSK